MLSFQLFVILSFFIFLTYSEETDGCQQGETEVYLLATNLRLDTPVYGQSFGDSLTECAERCRLDKRCRSLSYLKNSTDAICQLMEANMETSKVIRQKPLSPVQGINFLQKVCYKGACDRLFVVEWIQGMNLENSTTRIIKNVTQKQCIEACLSETTFICRSATLDSLTSECQLSRYDRFNRHKLFKTTKPFVHYFDNTCAYKWGKSGSKAEILLLGNVEHPYVMSEYHGISVSECGDLCLRNTKFPCRSFLSGRISGQLYCGLTHQNREGLLQNPGTFEPSKYLNYYELARNVEACDETDIHYELISGAMLDVESYMVTLDISTDECLDICKSETMCKSVSINYNLGSCQFTRENIRTALEANLLPNSSYNYYEKICLPGITDCERPWAIERVKGKELTGIDHVKTIVEANTREECEAACLSHKEPFICRSAEYRYQLSECHLSPYSRYTTTEKGVTLDVSRSSVDYLENNCVREPRGFCNTKYVPRHQMLLIDKTISTRSLDECRDMCLYTADFVCRSATYHSKSRSCELSHHTRKSAPEGSFVRSHTRDYVEISTCFDVTVHCDSETITANVKSNMLFKGKVYTKGNPLTCSLDVSNSMDFALPIPLSGKDCGTVSEEEGKFTNVVVIQSNDHVVTSMDKAIGVHCSFHVGNQTEETEVNVTGLNSTDHTRGSPNLPDLSLHIVDMKGQERETVSLGELLRVQVRMSNEDTYGIFVRNLVAKDGSGGNNLTLIDNTGCPVEVKMMREVRTIDPQSKSLEGYLEAFTFTGSSVLELEAEVETCLENCKPVLCQIPTGRREDDMETVSSFGRRKRDLSSEKFGEVLATTTLTRSIGVQDNEFGIGKPYFEANYAVPVTAPSFSENQLFEDFYQRLPDDVLFCFQPTLFALIGGLFLFAEVSAMTACLVLVCRWKKGDGKNRTLSIYYANSIDGSEASST
ncbi:uncharacterized protein [Centruroides vittatus]|uniref:uncharacterized protein n=1 Tax=Centruroides vittatus TaxID=120091 RepID=UPI00351039A0